MHHSLITTKNKTKKESFSSRFSRKLNNERFELHRKRETEKGLKDLYHGLRKKESQEIHLQDSPGRGTGKARKTGGQPPGFQGEVWKTSAFAQYQRGGWNPSHLGAVLRSNVSLLHLSRLSAHAYVRGVLSSD